MKSGCAGEKQFTYSQIAEKKAIRMMGFEKVLKTQASDMNGKMKWS